MIFIEYLTLIITNCQLEMTFDTHSGRTIYICVGRCSLNDSVNTLTRTIAFLDTSALTLRPSVNPIHTSIHKTWSATLTKHIHKNAKIWV